MEKIKFLQERCDLCGTCVSVCPPNVMEMTMIEVEIDQIHCTSCQRCVFVCPVAALVPGKDYGKKI